MVVLHDAVGRLVAAIAQALRIGLPAAKHRLGRGRMMLVSARADGNPKRAASLAQPVRCWQARRQISAYLDEELAPATQTAVESHLAVCPNCPQLSGSLVGLGAHLGDLRDADSVVPAEIAARVADRMSHVRSRARR